MKDKDKQVLSQCAETDFGSIALSRNEKAFYERFNGEILSLCRSMPDSLRTDSLLFLLESSGVNLGDELDFFAHYYPPSWSILYWLTRHGAHSTNKLNKGDMAVAIQAPSMAMFLHSLDDHLMDAQIPVTFLSLLLRSQAWMIMSRAFDNLAEGVSGGKRVVRRFIDEYCSSVKDPGGPDSLDTYCDLFRRQMGIGMIAPALLSMKVNGLSDFTRDLQTAYGCFGVAWRLLDDIRDVEADMEKRVHSTIYLCLPEKVRTHWDKNAAKKLVSARTAKRSILVHILEHRLIDEVRGRISAELERAACLVEAHGLTGLAKEFRCLAAPLANTRCTGEGHHGKPRISRAGM